MGLSCPSSSLSIFPFLLLAYGFVFRSAVPSGSLSVYPPSRYFVFLHFPCLPCSSLFGLVVESCDEGQRYRWRLKEKHRCSHCTQLAFLLCVLFIARFLPSFLLLSFADNCFFSSRLFRHRATGRRLVLSSPRFFLYRLDSFACRRYCWSEIILHLQATDCAAKTTHTHTHTHKYAHVHTPTQTHTHTALPPLLHPIADALIPS